MSGSPALPCAASAGPLLARVAGAGSAQPITRGPAAARRLLPVLAVALLSGHVGSPDTWFEGAAGPYPIQVVVSTPGVVPGLADVVIRLPEAGVSRVLVTSARYEVIGGEGGASIPPPPDVAEPVAGEPGLYAVRLWFMARGSHRVDVTVEGDAGVGRVAVPVMAQATARLDMAGATGVGLAIAALFLVAGLLTIVRAAVRESVVEPGRDPVAPRERRARFAVAGAAVLVALILFGGWRWWDAVDSTYRARLDRPWSSAATATATDGGRVLGFEITDSLWIMRRDTTWLRVNFRYPRTALVEDHGKLMHLFLVREPALDAFAHLHPSTRDSIAFRAPLYDLPAGSYRVYADVVQESAATQTMVAEVTVPAATAPVTGSGPPPESVGDPDDAWWTADAAGASRGPDAFPLESGLTMRWERPDGPIRVGQPLSLRFRVVEETGGPVALQPYMGMAGHAMINRDDGGVFVHLHPTGSVPMAARMMAERQVGIDSAMPEMEGSARIEDGRVAFPYAFPSPGSYRVWVQVRRAGGGVLTGAFDLEVEEAAPAP